MSGHGTVDTAVEATRLGAFDFIEKPLSLAKLLRTVERALESARSVQQRSAARRLAEAPASPVGKSPAMQSLFELVPIVAASNSTVLIRGDSGTGKELIAAAIHHNSPRKNGPFIKVNCAAITETLLESELFGHEKGAFTGAERRREGRFVQANGGSLFLDEVGEMPVAMQVKLLRVLQERELTRVGGEQVLPVDVRLIVATNRNLAQMVEDGAFRGDLFYRLNVVELKTPPLRERREDIPLLARSFFNRLKLKSGKNIQGVSNEALEVLMKYRWPGNVRELRNMIERAMLFVKNNELNI